MQRLESIINGAFGRYLAFIDWVAKNPNKYVWASLASVVLAVWF